MSHTYLRYECADSFGLVAAAASTATSAATLATIDSDLNSSNNSNTSHLVWTTAGSACHLWNLRTNTLQYKLGHCNSNNTGSGNALNSDQVVSISSSSSSNIVATGWTDGSVRVYNNNNDYLRPNRSQTYNSLLTTTNNNTTNTNSSLWQDPLTLQGHSSPVAVVVLENNNNNNDNNSFPTRLASGSTDGTVILWDLVAERGLFRLLGHNTTGAVTSILFLKMPLLQNQNVNNNNNNDLLVTTGNDGVVKIWDLNAQYCVQTLAAQGYSATSIVANNSQLTRLLLGGQDGLVRVYKVETSIRQQQQQQQLIAVDYNAKTDTLESTPTTDNNDNINIISKDDVCHFMGTLQVPPNVVVSSDRIICTRQFQSKFIGVLHDHAKTVEIYVQRSVKHAVRKKQRRLRRRLEKATKKNNNADNNNNNSKKRGILDDSDSENENTNNALSVPTLPVDMIKASDEFDYVASIRTTHKIKSFVFLPPAADQKSNEVLKVVCSLATNSLETHVLLQEPSSNDSKNKVWRVESTAALDMYGHPTGIRAIALASNDDTACTVSKSVIKLWNVATRSVISSIVPVLPNKQGSVYGLCAAFLPGNNHVVCGTREGHLIVINVASGEVVAFEEKAHDGAIWSIDVRRPTSVDPTVAILTGSADKSVKFWDVETAQDEQQQIPVLAHTRTIQMNDDVTAARYSNSIESSKLMVFVATLDSTIKVFFDDSLKLFLSLYGHKLPVLAVDASDDDTLLVSSGADKTIKIWGLDFGDTHRTLHGHEDSITDIKFVRRTHNFFSASKDGSIRYWDGDRFEQILKLDGHFGEVNCLAVSRAGAFVLTGGMDRQIRVWERTKDIVFLEEEREKELEANFLKSNNRDEGGTLNVLSRNAEDEDDDAVADDQPQSEAAVRKSVLSVAVGDRIIEALELADTELREIEQFKKTHGVQRETGSNPLLLNMTPVAYMHWVLSSIRHAEIEQGLLMLPLGHVERLLFYLIRILKSGKGAELCAQISVFLVKTHQNQLIANASLRIPLRELRRLIHLRLTSLRDMIGYDLAAMRLAGRVAAERKSALKMSDSQTVDIWAEMGLGSDVAAAVQGRPNKK